MLVADQAKEIAKSKGLYDSGDLIDSIKGGLKNGEAVVRVTALRNGFKYPAVYEFGRISPWQKTKGIRNFLEPAIEAKAVEIEAAVLRDMDQILQELARRG